MVSDELIDVPIVVVVEADVADVSTMAIGVLLVASWLDNVEVVSEVVVSSGVVVS